MKKLFCVRLDEEILNTLKKYAKKKGYNLSALTQHALHKLLKERGVI